MTGSLLLIPPGVLADFDSDVFFRSLFSDLFIQPTLLVIAITLIAQTTGIILGFPLALGRISKNRLIRLPVDAYLYVFRGTPLLLQVLFLSDGLALLFNNPVILDPISHNAVIAGTLALTLNEAAYMTEIIRSGLEAIDPGQIDAARALGMTPWQINRRIIIPQTMRIALPPTVNEYINMSKNTSLLTVISVNEILATAGRQYSANYRVFEILSVAALWYLLITTILTLLQKQVERRFGERQEAAVRPNFARRMFTGFRGGGGAGTEAH
ncbi:MAG: polar amino acid transport system permease protein [Chloroflexota bacterium]|jgi:polar amino acid transport system permease protein|nr:polar amino acid transport system permease protein [Chloroflexota bacterium]